MQPQILVFNKIDLVDQAKKADLEERFAGENAVFVSVKAGEGLEQLKALLAANC